MDSAALLDLLGNENRRRILRLLSRKPCYVTEISEYLGVSPKAVIDHLRKLEESGLVESDVDDGRRKYFSIARDLRLEVNVSPYEFGTKSAYSASPNLDITSWRYVSLHLGSEENAGTGVEATDAETGVEATDAETGVEATDAETGVEVTDAGAETTDGAADPDVPPVADAGSEDHPDGTGAEADAVAESPLGASGNDGPDEPPDLGRLVADLERLERLENELSMAQRWVQGRLTQTLDRISAHFEGVDGRFYGDLLRGLVDGPETAEALARRVDAPPDVVTDALEGLSAHGVVERRGDRWRLRTGD